jgi:hypothetical protein
MGTPQNYYVDPVNGYDNLTSGRDGKSETSAWKTVQFALSEGIDGAPTGSPYPEGHDTTNGVQINIKAGGSSPQSTYDGGTSIDVNGTYGSVNDSGGADPGFQASKISQAAPLIFRGYQTNPGDWYPGKSGSSPVLYGFYSPGANYVHYPIISDQTYGGTYKISSHLLFYDLVFQAGANGTTAHVQAYSANSFVNCKFRGGNADNPIQLSNDNTFVNCHFSNMGDDDSSDNCINHSGNGLTLINCVFDFLGAATKPFYVIKSAGAGSHHFTGNVFMCGTGCRVMNWSGTPAASQPGLLVLINNTFYSNATTKVQPFGGNNVAKRFLAIDNLTEGWSHGMVQKSNNNILAWGGNSAHNNTTNFPDGTDPDVWFEFAGGNFGATDANSNKTLSQSPFLDAPNKKMSCRPARTSGGDEAVVGQSVSLWEDADTIVKRGDRGAVPRGPLTLPVDGGVVG